MTAQTEQESIDILTSLMGDANPDIARRVYRKWNGDMHKAATAILEGDIGEPEPTVIQRPGTPVNSGSTALSPYSFPPPAPGLKPSPVIDLTGDDDTDMARALEASLETKTGPQFGPSERPPHPDWQVAVTENIPDLPAVSQDDREMSRAIQESLQGSYDQFADDKLEAIPLKDNIRKDNRPMALRPLQATHVYAALIIQALFFVPQVRIGIARFRPSTAGHAPDSEEETMWALVELYVNMDMVCLSEITPDEVIKIFDVQGWTRPTDQPGRLSSTFYDKISELVEQAMCKMRIASQPPESPPPKGRMFHFLYGNDGGDSDAYPDVTSIVSVTIGSNGNNHDLMSCLSAQFATPADEPRKKQDVILEPSDVVAFELISGSRVTTTERKPFSYPKSIFLDQFLQENAEMASATRAHQRDVTEEVEALTLKKKSLTSFDNKDTLKDLRSVVYYYENVADAKGDAARKADIDRTGSKLKRILVSIEEELKVIDSKIAQLKEDSQTLFDVPELRKHQYDLRAVLVHDGLFGRKSLYSYVSDQGKWWKTVDATVIEVTEATVLSDSSGLHLGAGPYLLIYSRQMSSEYDEEIKQPTWPPKLIAAAKDDTRLHLARLKEIGIEVENFFSPPESPTYTEHDAAELVEAPIPMEMY